MSGGKKFSLSFTKTIEKKNLQPSAIRNDAPQDEKLDTEALESIEENVMKTDGKIGDNELVIPLVPTDRISILRKMAEKKLKYDARLQGEESSSSKSKDVAQEPPENRILTLDEQAEAAIIEESKKLQEEWSDRGSEKSTMTIANVGAEDFMETELAVGKESSLDDYDQVEVSLYGAALLRGMGWDKAEGVGRVNKGVVEVIDPSAKTFGFANKGTNKAAENKAEIEEELLLAKGSYVFIHSGRQRGVYGTVDALDADHLMVQSAVGQDLIREVELNIRVVSQKEYKDSSRVINKDMYDKFKEEEAARKNKKIKSRSSKDSDDSESTDAKKSRKESTSQSKERRKEESSRSKESRKEPTLQSKESRKESTSQDSAKDHLKREETPSSTPPSKEKSEYPERDELKINSKEKSEYTERDELKINSKEKSEYTEREESKESEINSKEKSEYTEREESKIISKEKSEYTEREESKESKMKSEHSENERKKLDMKKEYDVPVPRKYEDSHSDKDKRDKMRDYNKRKEEKYKSSDYDKYANKSSDKERDRYYKSSVKYGKDHKRESKMHNREEDKSNIYEQDYKKAKQSQAQMPAMPWVRENLRVRLISKEYKGGRYHKEKVIVKFVETAESCECVTEEGKTIRDVHPGWLETVIPKVPPQNIMIVKGNQKGQRARILQLHKDQEMASVQMMDDNTIIVKLHYDDICEYVSRY